MARSPFPASEGIWSALQCGFEKGGRPRPRARCGHILTILLAYYYTVTIGVETLVFLGVFRECCTTYDVSGIYYQRYKMMPKLEEKRFLGHFGHIHKKRFFKPRLLQMRDA